MTKCYQLLKEYDKALICAKKQLVLAWHIQNSEAEIKAYGSIAIQYFHLGDVDKSKYYNDRMLRGKCEAKFSIVRKMSEHYATKQYKLGLNKRYKTPTDIESGIRFMLQDISVSDPRKDFSII